MGFFDSVKKGFQDAVEFSTGKTTLDKLGGGDFTSLIPGIGDAQAAAKQNQANIDAAQRAMNFSERMSSTAYQRGMKDMREAGLNPMLAFSQGGASAPSGVTPTLNSETKSGFGDFALKSATGIGGLATARQVADTQQAVGESTVNLNKGSTAKTVQDVAESSQRTAKLKAETDRLKRYGPRDEAQLKLEKNATDLVDKLLGKIGNSAKQVQESKRSLSSRIWDQMTGKNAPVQSPQARKDAYKPNAKGYGR